MKLLVLVTPFLGFAAALFGFHEALEPGAPPMPAQPPQAATPPAGLQASPYGRPVAATTHALAPVPESVQPFQRNTVFRTGQGGDLVIDDVAAGRLRALAESLPAQHSLAELEQVEAIVREGLREPQAAQALRLLNSYLGYTRAEALLLA